MQATSSQISARPSNALRKAPLAVWIGIAVILIVLGFVGTSSGQTESDVLYDYTFGISSIVIYSILVGITLVIAAALGQPLEAAGLKRFAWRWVWIAIALIVLVLIVANLLEPLLHAGKEQGLEPKDWRPDRARAFALNALVISTFVPFAEELFFRGVGVRAWLPFGAGTAIVVTALCFALGHGLFVALPVLVPFGLAQAWVRWRSDSVWPGVIAHGFYNGSAVLLLYVQLTN
jgi:membrane protease YdiL (CAAX protease family)